MEQRTVYTEEEVRGLFCVYLCWHRPKEVTKKIPMSSMCLRKISGGFWPIGKRIPYFFGLRKEGGVYVSDVEGII